MTTLYTDEAKALFRASKDKFPKGLIIDVVESEFQLHVILYRDNFETFDGVDKEQIAANVKTLIESIRGIGIPCYLGVERTWKKEETNPV